MRRLVLIGCFVGLAATASAQTGALASATLAIYQAGATAPFQTSTIPLPSGATCGQPLFPTAPPSQLTNPTRIIWSDPANTALICVADRTAFLLALPVGTGYTATLTFTNDAGVTSGASNVSNPFTRVAPLPLPPVPTGVQVRP